MSGRKLNYLLAMPRLVQNIGDGYSFPLGIAYVSASLKHAGFNVFTVNLNHQEGSVTDIIHRLIETHSIDVVATGGLSFQYNTINSVLEAAKLANNKIITVVGGGIVNGDPEATMNALQYADVGIVGEGEVTFCEYATALENNLEISAVNGLIIRMEHGYIRTDPRSEIDDLDGLPWPDYAGFDIETYLNCPPAGISGLNEKRLLFMLGSRSCPYNCTFCFHTVGRKYRQRSLESVFAEIEYLVKKYDIRYICMADELFARNHARVKQFSERMKQLNLHWWAQFRVDDVNEELIRILKDGNCTTMSFGLESADNRILKSMRKHTTVEQIERTLKIVYDSGISLEGCFIFGDIEETVETANNTLKWWRDHAEYKINLNLITVFPGSFLYKHACEKGIIKDRAQFLRDGCPQINVSKLTDHELSLLVRDLLEAPNTLVRSLDNVELVNVDSNTGRICVSGVCSNCSHGNEWSGIKIFSSNFIACAKCGQKYNIPLPVELRKNIDRNIFALLEKFGKVAVWGINYHTLDLFNKSSALLSPGVFPVDISGVKQLVNLNSKKVFAPKIVKEEDIRVVIVAIPAYISQISSQITNNYPQVSQIIDICNLVSVSCNTQPKE